MRSMDVATDLGRAVSNVMGAICSKLVRVVIDKDGGCSFGDNRV